MMKHSSTRTDSIEYAAGSLDVGSRLRRVDEDVAGARLHELVLVGVVVVHRLGVVGGRGERLVQHDHLGEALLQLVAWPFTCWMTTLLAWSRSAGATLSFRLSTSWWTSS